eukprot:TRINITY_DN21971_c0_g1_i1.p1 TRINITY_DN21971_c0_g1~~TRINITY_DN21971_c0_g1_i1.p1  ORF type:complete len:461 (-),score=90.60 TRINITY_DN21971_c0_g1_i1:129-1511(-)
MVSTARAALQARERSQAADARFFAGRPPPPPPPGSPGYRRRRPPPLEAAAAISPRVPREPPPSQRAPRSTSLRSGSSSRASSVAHPLTARRARGSEACYPTRGRYSSRSPEALAEDATCNGGLAGAKRRSSSSASTAASSSSSSNYSGSRCSPPPSGSSAASVASARAAAGATPSAPSAPCAPRRPFRLATLDVERCGCCTKEDFWILYDAFETMDRRHLGSISRADFHWALRVHGAMADFTKACHRSRLPAYFHDTSQALSFEAFVGRAYPSATDGDMARMRNWTDLRVARGLLRSSSFRATEGELRQVFALLDEDSSGALSVKELVRAQIFSKEDIDALLPPSWMGAQLEFQEFAALAVEKFADLGRCQTGEAKDVHWRTGLQRLLNEARHPLGCDSPAGCASAPLPPLWVSPVSPPLSPVLPSRRAAQVLSRRPSHQESSELRGRSPVQSESIGILT